MFQISMRFMLTQRRRTLITIVSMILAVAMVTSVGLIVSSLQNMLITSQTYANGTWHYKLTLQQNIDEASMLKLMELNGAEGVEASGFINEQTFLQMPDGSGNYYGLKRLDAQAFSLMPYQGRITAGRMPQNENEIIISNGSAAFWGIKDPLGIEADFSASERLNMTFVQTVKGETATITTTQSQISTYQIVGTFERFRSADAPNISEAATVLAAEGKGESLYIRLAPGGNYSARINRLILDAGLDGQVTLEAHTRYLRWMMQGDDAVKYIFAGIFAALTLAVLLVMLVVIKNSYVLSVIEKSEFFGTIRCLNATKRQIRSFVLWEGIMTWLVAFPLGCFAGWLAMQFIINLAARLDVSLLEGLSMKSPAWPYVAAAGASFLTMFFSIHGAHKRASAITPVEAFRGNDPYQSEKDHKVSPFSKRLGKILPAEWLLVFRDRQKNRGRFRITVLAISVSVALFISFVGAAITITDFMGSYIQKSGMDFYFASSHHVEKSADSFSVLRQDLSRYSEIAAIQEVYPIEYLLDVPDNKVAPGYESVWERYYPVDLPFMQFPAFDQLGKQLKNIEIIPVNRANYAQLPFIGDAPAYDALLASGGVIFSQSEVFRKNGLMHVQDFAVFNPGDKVRVAQRVSEEMMDIRELTLAAVLQTAPWFAPERTHGFILVPIETIENYFESTAASPNLYTTGLMSILGVESQLAILQDTLSERSVSAFGALNGFVFNSPFASNQDVGRQVDLINVVVYGFITLIGIICGLNILNTVWADLESRRREIALLRAIGMDSVRLINYLHGGCLQYAVYAMIPGSVLGYLILVFAVRVLQDYLFISIQSPLLIIAGTFAVTMVLTLLAGSVPISRFRKAPVVEELRAIS